MPLAQEWNQFFIHISIVVETRQGREPPHDRFEDPDIGYILYLLGSDGTTCEAGDSASFALFKLYAVKSECKFLFDFFSAILNSFCSEWRFSAKTSFPGCSGTFWFPNRLFLCLHSLHNPYKAVQVCSCVTAGLSAGCCDKP